MNTTTRNKLLAIALGGLGSLATLLLADRVLSLLGFPAETPIQVAHPPNVDETRRNLEFVYRFTTNSQGLRYREIPLLPGTGEHRIFVVGDSFTEGGGVDVGARFTDRLETRFTAAGTRTLFLNDGLGGTGPLQYGRLFLHVGRRYHPGGLLICLYGNDVSDTSPGATAEHLYKLVPPRHGLKRWGHAFLPRTYILARGFAERREQRQRTQTDDFVALVSREAAKRGIAGHRIEAWRRSLPPQLVAATNRAEFGGPILAYGLLQPNYWSDAIDIDTKLAAAKWHAFTALLEELVGECRRRHVRVGIVYIPHRFLYDPASHAATNPWIRTGSTVRRRWLSETTVVQQRLAALAKAVDVPLLDLTPVFRQATSAAGTGPRLTFPLDGHWTAAGHAIAARAIGDWLAGTGVFPFLGSNSESHQLP